MALSLNISSCIKNACRTLSISELTGLYDVNLNNTGWETPNPAIADVVTWSLEITRPDLTTITIDEPVGLPTSSTVLEYEISASTVNSDWSKFLDGLYTITYTVVVDIAGTYTTYTVTKYILVTCNIECCVARLFAKIATDSDCECDSLTIKNALYADALLQGLLASKNCGNVTAINNLLTKLNKICTASTSDCGCGS